MDGEEKQNFSDYVAKENAFIYSIKGRPAFAFGDIYLKPNQKVIADSRALLWMDGEIDVGTNMRGGCCAGFMRNCSGEPCCLNDYDNKGNDNAKVSVGFQLPGDIMAFGVTPDNGWVFTYDAFIAGSNNLVVSSRFSGCCACIFADESVFLTTAKVKQGEFAIVLAGSYGMIERHEVPDGETLLVSRGLFFAARSDVSFDVGLIGQECCGLCNLCITGGGIVYKFHGPCVVYTQSKSSIRLLREFGIPDGKEREGPAKIAQCGCQLLCCVLKVAGEVAKNGGGGGGGGGGQ